MKNNILLLFFAFGLCANDALYAQLYNQKELDSLEKRLTTYQKQDSIRLELMNDIIFEYAYSSPKKGLILADKAISLGKHLKLNKQISATYNYKALCYANDGNDSLAVVMYNKSLENSKTFNLKESYASTLNNMAILYTNQGKYKEGLKLREEAFEIFKPLGNDKKNMIMLQNIGVSYFFLGNYTQAIKNYNQARMYALKSNDLKTENILLNNIALCYSKLDQPKLALAYYQKSLAIANKHEFFELQINTLSNLGNLFSDMNEQNKAIDNYNTAINIANKTGNTRGLLSPYTNLADLYLKQKEYEKAHLYFSKAEELSKKTQNKQAVSLLNNGMATIMLNATDKQLIKLRFDPKQKLNIAEKYSLKALASAKETESPENIMHANATLSLIYQRQGQYKLALINFKNYATLKDSLFNDEKKIEFIKQEMSFETDKQKLVAHEQLLKEKTARKLSTFIGAVIFATLIVGFFIYKYIRDSRQLRNELLHQAQTAETEMRILRLQMNPHFIFNSLNSISDYMHKNDIEKADYYLGKFAKLMRGILENAEEKEITLAEEINMIEAYMQLEASRLKHKFAHEINIADDIDKEHTYILPLIMQPFIENSIWHGLAHKEDAGKINIDISRNGDMLKYVIEDNGVGRKKNSSNKQSYGIKITNERLTLLKNPKANIKIIDLAQGTRVEISLPFETEKVS